MFLTIGNCFKTLFHVRKIEFDIIFDLEIFSHMSSIFVFLCGKVFSIGFGSFNVYRDVFYNSVVAFDHSKHMIDIYLKMAGILGIEIREKKITKFSHISRELESSVARIIGEIGFDQSPIVFVNVNAGEMTLLRRLPLEKMTRILTEVAKKKPDFRFIFIGSLEEHKFVDHYFETLPPLVSRRAVNLSGKTSISELLALLKFGKVYLGNDSGPLHLAAALGLPTIAFFGPETPNLYGYNSSPHKMFYTNHFCSPCLNSFKYKVSKCERNVCLENIEEEPVVKALIETVENRFHQTALIP